MPETRRPVTAPPAAADSMPSPTEVRSSPLRIRVTNLDSIEQAQAWRRYGPQEAIARVIAMVRSALLLSEEIVLDRNQLLDGIALLAIGPDDLRWHLGLPPHARLPIVVSCAPDPETGRIEVPQQLAAVNADGFVSAARTALDLRASTGGGLDWLMPDPETAPVPMHHTFATSWDARREPAPLPAAERLRTARQAWGEAMSRGEVTLLPWNRITLRTDLGDARSMTARHPVLGELLEAIGDRTERSTALRILDGLRETYSDDECRSAFRWWTRKYYDAVCDAHDEMRISFSPSDEDGSDAGWDSIGPRSWWQMMRSRVSRREVHARSEVPFEGEIVEHMRGISPSAFHQLRRDPTGMHSFWDAPSNRKIWDLALSVRRSVSRPQVRRGRLQVELLAKALLAVSVAVLLSLRDLQVLPTDTGWWIVFWGILAFVLGFPWVLLVELTSLTSFSMTATLRIADDRVEEHAPSAPRSPAGRPDPAPSAESPPPAAPPLPAEPAPSAASAAARGPSDSGQLDWQEVWRAEGFDLSMQRSTLATGSTVHRLIATGGRAGAVAVCRRTSDTEDMHRTLLVRTRRPAVDAELWELPRGFGDGADPDPARTAHREYTEETGLRATVNRDLGPLYPDSGMLANPVHAVLLDAAGAAATTTPDGEVASIRWFTDAEIDDLIRSGQIADGITLAALHLAAVHDRRRQHGA